MIFLISLGYCLLGVIIGGESAVQLELDHSAGRFSGWATSLIILFWPPWLIAVVAVTATVWTYMLLKAVLNSIARFVSRQK